MELSEREIKKISEDIIGAGGGQLVLGLIAGNSNTLQAGVLGCPDSCRGILEGHGSFRRTVNALAGQSIDARIGFPFANIVACNHGCEMLQ